MMVASLSSLMLRMRVGLWSLKEEIISLLISSADCVISGKRKDEIQSRATADALMVRCIRRAMLDAFWSRGAGTVTGSRSSMKATFRCANMVRVKGIFPKLGPFPLRDVDGMGLVVVQLLKTLDPGKHEKYVQFDMVKNVRMVFCRLGGFDREQGPDGNRARYDEEFFDDKPNQKSVVQSIYGQDA
jgi:hypothetical protein